MTVSLDRQCSSIEGYPLSPQQLHVWQLQKRDETACPVVRCAVLAEGKLNVARLRAALRTVLDRHEILRTSFRRLAEMAHPLQVIDGRGEVPLREVDWSLMSVQEQAKSIRRDVYADGEGATVSEMAGDVGLQARLFKLGPRRHLLLLGLAAMRGDAASMRHLVREVAVAYGSPQELSTSVMQYADLSQWLNELVDSDEGTGGVDYWASLEMPDLQQTTLPFDAQRTAGVPLPHSRGFAQQMCQADVDRPFVSHLQDVASECGVTPDLVLLAGWMVLLWRLNDSSQVAIGVLYDGRHYEELADVIGPLAKYVPVCCELDASSTFLDMLRQLNRRSREAQTWQECFTWNCVSHTSDRADSAPFLPYGYDYFDAGSRAAQPLYDGVSFTIAHQHASIDRFVLKLSCVRQGDQLAASLAFDSRRFLTRDIQRLLGQWMALVGSAVARPSLTLDALRGVCDGPCAELSARFNESRHRIPESECVHQLIERQARCRPDAVAIVVDQEQISYGQLERRANQLAHELRRLGVGPDVLVALFLERSLDWFVGMFAVLKAGGAYLPLDPSQPKPRIDATLSVAGPRVVLTQKAMLENVGEQSSPILCLDRDWPTIARQPNAPCPATGVRPENTAYVLFTSGSTGIPKGVAVEHRQLVNYVQAVTQRLKLPTQSSYATVSTLAADLGNTAIYPALCHGGRLHAVDRLCAADARQMTEYFTVHLIDCLKIVPSHLRSLLQSSAGLTGSPLPAKRLVMGGEAADWDLVRQIRERAPALKVFNHYGPTEATVGVLTCELSLPADRGGSEPSLPLGRPIDNTQVHLCDARLQSVPTWVQGEIHVSGAAVARGYLHRPELTAQRFLPDPFTSLPGGRLYRTGDMARMSSRGELEFLGRRDNQVKIRGFRIELGEIEAVVRQSCGVKQCAVVLHRQEPGNERIVAYVVPDNVGLESMDGLRAALADKLPDYMIPAAIVPLKALPITANGKLDTTALPAPDHDRTETYGELAAPRNVTEQLLQGIWLEVLRVDAAGIHDDFFSVGGHSLLVTRLAARVAQTFHVELPFSVLFEKRTIADLAQSIQAAQLGDDRLSAPPIVSFPRDGGLPLSFAQQRLWFYDYLVPNSPDYNVPGVARLAGRLDLVALQSTLREVVRRHEVLRTTFPSVHGQPTQHVTERTATCIPVTDLSQLPGTQRDQQIRRLVQEHVRRPFNLARGPLLRVNLLRLSDDDHILICVMHHIISDALSVQLLVREVATVYKAVGNGSRSPLPPLPIQYADYASWQRQWLQGDVLVKHLQFWQSTLAGAPAKFELPADRPRAADHKLQGARRAVDLSKHLTSELRKLSRREGVTLFMTLLAAFKSLLHHYTAAEDLVVGTNVANRSHSQTENLIGFFINQLVLRTNLAGDPTCRELLARVRRVSLDAYAHQDLPFERLVEELQPQRDLSRSLLFQIKFELQDGRDRALDLADLAFTPLEIEDVVVRHDLHLCVVERDEELTANALYDCSLFDAGTIERMLKHFEHVLTVFVERCDTRLSDLVALLAQSDHEYRTREEQSIEAASLQKLRDRRRRPLPAS